jgi:hypothetical protein
LPLPPQNFGDWAGGLGSFSSDPISAPALHGSLAVSGYLPCFGTLEGVFLDWVEWKISEEIVNARRSNTTAN